MDYDNPTKTDRMTATLAKIDGGAAAGPATLVIGTAGMAAVLVSIPLAEPSGAVSGQKIVFTDPAAATATGAGTAAAAEIRDSDGVARVTGLTVGLTGGSENVKLATVNITVGLGVDINPPFEITHF